MKKFAVSLIVIGVITLSLLGFRLQSINADKVTTTDTRAVQNLSVAFAIENFVFQPSREGYVEIVFDAVNNSDQRVHYFELTAKLADRTVTLGTYTSEAKPFKPRSKLQVHRTVTKDYVAAQNFAVRVVVFSDGTFVGDARRGNAIVAEREATNRVAQQYEAKVQALIAISPEARLKTIQELREKVMTESRAYPRRQAPAVRTDEEYVALASEQATLDALLDLATRLEFLEKDAIKGNPDQSRAISDAIKRMTRYK